MIVVAAVLALVAPGIAHAQVFVAPSKAEQSRVRYFEFDWKHLDILTDAQMATPRPVWTSTVATSTQAGVLGGLAAGTATTAPVSKAGGMKLYFYDQGGNVASRAAGSIEQTYLELIQEFGYVPKDQFPYMLYSSYQEFLQTNLFPVREGVLGVTSTQDLKLALPFFGDYQMFREVSRHEMAHQFTIQKAREAAEAVDGRNGLGGIPLWVIEGLAEFYAKRGVDHESELLALDLVLNANVMRGYGMLGFFEDRPGSVLWTYKIGLVRCIFMEETYGKGTIQRILEASPLLAGDVAGRARLPGFPALLQAITGDSPELVSAKFAAWIKRRMMPSYLRARQSPVDVESLPGQPEYIDSVTSSPNGRLIAVRTLEIDTGQSQLLLLDERAPGDTWRVAIDGVPGAESMHPFAGKNFALSNDAIAYVAQSGGADVLYVHHFQHHAEKLDPLSDEGFARGGHASATRWTMASLKPRDVYDVDLGSGRAIGYELGARGILAVYAPAFSPDGKSVAFVGLDRRGQRDIYVLSPVGAEDAKLVRVTEDEYAERAVAWGKQGIIFTSDRNRHGKHNLFRVRPEAKAPIIPLVDEPREHLTPMVTPDGRIYFVAYADARANLYEVTDTKVVQRTDFATALFDPGPGPDGGIWGLFHHGGERRIVKVAKEKLLDLEAEALEPELFAAMDQGDRPAHGLDGAIDYRASDVDNWHLDNIFALAGFGGGYLYGQIFAAASDRMSDHALLLQLLAYGSLDLTDGRLVYINQRGRFTWGVGPFQSLQYRFDDSLRDALPNTYFTSYERFFGGLGVIRYPFNQFFYVQGEVAIGGASFALSKDTRQWLNLQPDPTTGQPWPEDDPRLDQLWEERNGGVRFQGRSSLSLGYSTLRYHRSTGPLDGTSALLETSFSMQPFDDDVYALVQLDLERYFQLIGRVNFFVRGGAGTTIGGKEARQFLLYSFDTVRGAPFQDTDFLLGRHYVFSTAELQFPLNFILAFALISDIEGVVGFDFGGVNDERSDLFDNRMLNFVWGFNFGLGPLVLRLHFAKPLDIGAPMPNGGDWNTNFSLGWLYF
ncbi:tolB protein precursor protein [Myxococcota bacterium]|nr:tolB protein precursor protein [Myxococcota bacterium]